MSRLKDLHARSESQLYEELRHYVATSKKLEKLGYAQEDVSFNEGKIVDLRRKAPFGVTLHDGFKPIYECARCKKNYPVDTSTGMPKPDTCIHHPCTVYTRNYRKYADCCRSRASSAGCTRNDYHVHRDQTQSCNFVGYVRTQSRSNTDRKVFALDTEMCFTTIGLELTQVTLLDYRGQVVYDELCKPSNRILNYNTKFTGLEPGDLDEVYKTLADVQRDLLEMISAESILIGHGLDSDLKALKMFHGNIVDTAELFPHKLGLPRKKGLKQLAADYLGLIIQDGESHMSAEDARAAFKLALRYIDSR